jgi:phosphoribosyl-ATP pyrophosphohydrolase
MVEENIGEVREKIDEVLVEVGSRRAAKILKKSPEDVDEYISEGLKDAPQAVRHQIADLLFDSLAIAALARAALEDRQLDEEEQLNLLDILEELENDSEALILGLA